MTAMSAHTVESGAIATTASVTLDVGAGRGALVIYPSARYRGREIEISPVDEDAPRVHTGVHERHWQGGSALTAIFGSLQTGEYVVWADADTRAARVEVCEGAVTEIALP
jgi:hypothetical protein